MLGQKFAEFSGDMNLEDAKLLVERAACAGDRTKTPIKT